MQNDTSSHIMENIFKQIAENSLKTSPTEGNGYGILLAVLLCIIVLFGSFYVWDIKQRRKISAELREQERSERQAEIERRERQSGEIKAAIAEHAGESRQRYDQYQKEMHGRLDVLRDQITAHGERLARIEAKT